MSGTGRLQGVGDDGGGNSGRGESGGGGGVPGADNTEAIDADILPAVVSVVGGAAAGVGHGGRGGSLAVSVGVGGPGVAGAVVTSVDRGDGGVGGAAAEASVGGAGGEREEGHGGLHVEKWG